VHRRNFALLIGSSLAAMNNLCRARSDWEGSVEQEKYLFWLDRNNRISAQISADDIVSSLVSDGDKLLSAANILYKNADKSVRDRFSLTGFTNRIVEYRMAAGPIAQRSFQGVEGGFITLPNLPRGRYCIVIYDLLLENSNSPILTEQVTLSLSPELIWQFAAYYLGTKPFYRS